MHVDDAFGTRQAAARDIREPVPCHPHGFVGLTAMAVDIHPGQIRNGFLVAVLLCIENENALLPLRGDAEFPGAEEEAELQRHVETRQPMDRVDFGS
jgi:hypothetical protein